LIAWFHDGPGREAMGAPPDGVALAPFPDDVTAAPDRERVEFVVPRWGDVPALDELPALRVVQVLSAGVDWIAGRVPPGVTLCSARGARDDAMAEWVLWAILTGYKCGRAVADQQASRTWRHLEPRDVRGARVLILGHGSIGAAVERLLAPFGTEVVRVARHARDGVHGVDELSGLLPRADVLVVLLPLTKATRGLVDARVLKQLPDGALLVNAGRGAVVDTDALVAELKAKRLRAALDVVEPEPLPDDHPLWKLRNALISPHVSGDSPAADEAAARLMGEQLRRLAWGAPLRNVVDRDG